MKDLIPFTNSIRFVTHRPARSFLRCSLLHMGMALSVVWFALIPTARGQDACREGCDFPLAGTYLGNVALIDNTTGFGNTAVGSLALAHNTTGNNNTAVGDVALVTNTTGSNNSAIGYAALDLNTGNDNTATGFGALTSNTTGSRNVATGSSALNNNETGIDNTATGVNALAANTASYNTATGYQTLENNTTGTSNTATGLNALNKNVTGSFNAASGAYALYSDTAGYNTADGYQALYRNTTGSHNIALGYNAGYSLTTGSNNIEIGNSGLAAEANTIRIGARGSQTNTYIAGISGATVAGGVGVVIDTNGHLGTVVSSQRFKENVRPMEKESEALLSLRPVTFRYKHELDPADIPQFGLVAEDVAKVNPDLVARDEEGKPYTVRYEAVNAMLLNEFLKEHHKSQEQDAAISQLKSTLARQQTDFKSALAEQGKQLNALTAALKEQAAQVQKVSARLIADQSRPRLVGRGQ